LSTAWLAVWISGTACEAGVRYSNLWSISLVEKLLDDAVSLPLTSFPAFPRRWALGTRPALPSTPQLGPDLISALH
jgi:hypothetical protein